MRKIKLFLSIVLSIFFLASCSLNSTQRPANPGNDVIEPGEEGYTVTVKDFETKELIISLTKKSTNIIRFADLKLNEIEGYTITLVDEVGNPTEIEDIKHTCTLYVKYAPNTYKLSFIEQGSRVETLKVTYNENVSPIEATLIPTGYEFLGWSEKKDEYVPYTFDKMPAHNVEVYAHYQLKEYAITLETKIAALEGLANISKYHYNDRLNNFVPLELQEAIKALPKYTLVGWYIDEALTIPFENISMPACDLTLYAKWEYDGLSFVDGNNIIGIGSGSIGDPIITPTPVEKEGFQFIGWYYDEEFTNEVKPGDLITEGLQNIYAYYKPLNNVEYRVEYYLQTFGVSYTLTKTDKFSGTTGTLVNADVLAFEGFTFDQSNSNNLLQANILANGSLTLKVYYSRNAYNVVYNTYDGEYATYENVKYGDAVLKPANPSRVGYTFAGWDQEVPTLMPNNDVVLNALWTANTNTAYKVEHYIEKLDGTYELKETENLTGTTDTNAVAVSKLYSGFTFNASHALNLLEGNIEADGSRVLKVYYSRNSYTLTINVDGVENNVSYKYEEAVALPTTPTKVGYTFSTWSPEVPSTMPANNVKVVAEWQVNEYTLTINVDGVKTEVVYEYGETVEAPTDPSKDGHTFTGWSPEVPSTMPAQNLTINATWKVNQYTITIKYDNETEDKVITQDYDSVIEIVPDPSKTGHTFTGWVTDTGVATVVPAVMPAKDLELTATWSINEYTITIKYDNETEDKVITQDYNTNIETIENPTKVGHTFTGWNQEIPSKMPAQNLTIKATWKVNQYTITIKYDNDSEDKVITQDYDTVIEIVPDPSKTGHTFTGWITDTGVAAVVPSVMPAKDLELTATWSINEYTITIKYDNESEDKVITQDYNTNIETIENPTKVGHTFTGWDQEIPSKMPAQNLTIKATWKVNQYTITIKYDNETEDKVITQDYDSVIEIVPDPSKTGHTFTGWVTDTGVATVVPTVMPAKDLELNATWSINEYTITIKYDNETEDKVITQDYNTNIETIENPTKVGHTFTGWDQEIPSKMPAQNLTINATWEINEYSINYDLDGGTFVKYETREEMVADFIKDFSAFSGETITTPAAYWKSGSKTSFWRDAEMHAKWSWIFEALIPYAKQQVIDLQYLNNMLANPISISGYATQNVAIYLLGINATIWNETYKATYGGLSSIYTTVDCTSEEVLNSWEDYSVMDFDTKFTIKDQITLVNPNKFGYTFLGWFDTNNQLVTNIPQGTSNDVELKAKWEANPFNITYNLDGGSFARYETREEMVDDFLADFSTFSGETITTPAAYWKSGSKTSFWRDAEMHAKWSWIFEALIPYAKQQGIDLQYLNNMLANPISISGYATQNVAIYLLGINATIWNETYKETYGGLSSIYTTVDCTSAEVLENWKDYCLVDYPKTFTVDDEVALVNPKKLGYTFLGWYDSNNNLVTSIAVGTSNDVELTAKWEAKEYTVTVDIDGVKTPYTFTYGETIEIADPTKTGHTFTGWTPSLPSTMPANNLEVAARWTIKQFTITIVYDNGNENTVITQDYNSAIEAVADPTKTGHTFAGWSQAIPSTMPAEDLTIRANWTVNKYAISYDVNSGTGSIESAEATYGVDFVVSDGTGLTAPTGKKLFMWTDAEGNEYILGETYQFSADTILVAVWEAENLLAKFDLGANGDATHKDGGTASSYSLEVPGYLNTYTLDLTSLSKVYKNAYDAKGNSCLKLGTGSATASFSFTVPDDVKGVVIYVSGYKANKATITINGVEYSINTSSDEGAYTAIKVDTSSVKTINFATLSTPDERCMINGFEFLSNLVEYTISFNANGGSGSIAEATVNEANKYTIPDITGITPPTGKKFSHWEDADGEKYNPLDEILLTKDTELIAQWVDEDVSKEIGTVLANNTDGTEVEVEGTVVAVSTKGFVLQDATGAVFIYQNAMPTVAIGDTVNVKGTLGSYNGGRQIASPTVAETTIEKYTPEAATVLTKEQLEAFAIAESVDIQKISINGSILINGNYYNLILSETTLVQGSLYNPIDEIKSLLTNNKEVIAEGYVIYTSTSNGNNYINVIVTSIVVADVSVSFSAGEGTGTIDSQTVKSGDSITIPSSSLLTAPSGKVFINWVDQDGVEYEEGTTATIYSSTTLTAVWGNSNITISFNANGGTGSVESQTITSGGSIVIPNSDVLSYEGMKFSHWEDADGNEYQVGDTAYFDVTTELKAIWIDQYFLAEFEFGENVDTGHADGSSIDSSKNYTSGSYSLAITGASKVYDGANDALGNSALKLGTSSAAGKLSFTVPDDVTEVIIYVAGYKAKTAKVLVNGIEYTVTEQSDSGEYLAIKVNTSVNKNVSFETLSGGYRAMIDKIEFKNTPQQIENITISFNIGEGTGSIASQEIAKGSTLIIPDATGLTAPTGKALSHWTDASAKEYAIGSEEVFNEATELIAVWVDLITISFNVNGGTGSIESISILKDSECEIPDGTVLTPPSGMKFSHWTDVSENIYNSGYKYTFDVSTELIAVWISDSITITKADLDTMNGGTANYSYGTYTSTNGWVVENAAVNSGHDDAGHASNPNFGCLGDASVRAVTLNGRTTAVGKLTSPVLDGGLSKVSFNYAWLFSDTKFSITINVKDVDGNIIRTKTLEWTNSTVSKQTAEQFVWELESPVSGQYQIEFVNNCPSASTSNKDRATIWNIELAGYNA